MKFALKILQMFSILLMLLMILLFVLTVFSKITWGVFFFAAALLAFIAYVLIPRIRNTLQK